MDVRRESVDQLGDRGHQLAALVLAMVGVILVVLGVRLAASPIRDQRRRIEPDECSVSDPSNVDSLPV